SSLSVATSVAITFAPSAMKASAIARPMPWPAAVTSASLFFSRSVMPSPCHSGRRASGDPESRNTFIVRFRIPGSRFARNDMNLMIVTRDTVLGDALIFHGRLQHHAVRQLVDHGALNFLPWRLARRVPEAATPEQCLPSPYQLGFR